jgi:plastocyanin
MGRPFGGGAIALTAMLLAACADPGRPTGPTTVSAARVAAAGGAATRLVNMKDACDPTTFAAVGCTRQGGGVTFTEFIAQLTKHGEVGAWHFAPPHVETAVGTTLLAVNRGGEVHTFTEVAHFGGGIVPQLNALSGNPVPAPECLSLEPDDFVPPGGTYPAAVEEPGTELYQCCIHPWMRTVVHAGSR